MEKIIVVGSGASGVHFALSVLRKGYQVTMLDVGHPRSQVMNPNSKFSELKGNLNDPIQYFLGDRCESIVFPGSSREYYTKPYAFPPNKNYIFSRPHRFGVEAKGFEPVFSFAQGGLAEAWTGGVYPLNDSELKEFPFKYRDIEPYYDEVAKRIGISGAEDDLARFYPVHQNLEDGLRFDENSRQLVAQYERQSEYLARELKSYMGRSRVATLSRDRNDRKGCVYCGRCLWGCPTEALYTPSITLEECRKYSNFTYIPDRLVSHFRFDASRRIIGAVAESLSDSTVYDFEADKFVLAAGTLSSSKIILDSIFRATGQIVKLHGLMDNRQILIPFLNLNMIGKPYDPNTYQYHELAIGIEGEKPEEYMHAQITTLKTALGHPIILNVPFDLRTSILLFRNVRAGLGALNLNLHDTRREGNYVTLQADGKSVRSTLVVNYLPREDEHQVVRRAVEVVKKIMWRLGCVVPPGMVHMRPMGSSVHYAGIMPMSMNKTQNTTSKYCQSHDIENLYLVDGSTFPFLPAKNLTFTLMANAVRVAESVF